MCLLAAQASAEIVIRERVEVQPRVALGPSSSLQDAGGTALCGEPVVGTVRYDARGGPSQAIYVIDGDLSTSEFPGEIVVTTECGAGAGPLARGFQYGSTWENHYGDGIHRHSFGRVDTVTVFEIDLKPLDRIQSRIQIPAAGLDQGFGSAWIHYFGCANGENCAEVSHEVKGGAFGIQRIVTGAATGTAPLQPDWPDVLVCGTTAPVAFVAVRPGPTEGWLDPESQASVRLNDEVDEPVAARAHLVVDGGTPTLDLDTDYASVRRGEVLLVAPPCSEVPVPRLVRVKGVVGGRTAYESVRLTPPPPVALALSAERDTVWVSGPVGSRIRATAIRADSAVTMMDPTTTPITFTAESEWLEVRQEDVYEGGPTRTVPYLSSTTDDASEDGVVVRVPFAVRSGPGPVCDTPVDVTASGGGVSGATTVVVAGHSTATAPDSLIVTATPDALWPDEYATVRAVALTEQGCTGADLDPDRTFEVQAFPYQSARAGVLVNDRTGERDAGFLLATYADLRAGRIRFIADTAEVDPPTALTAGTLEAATEGRPNGRREATDGLGPPRERARDEDVRAVREEGRPVQGAAALTSDGADERRVRVEIIDVDSHSLSGWVDLVVIQPIGTTESKDSITDDFVAECPGFGSISGFIEEDADNAYERSLADFLLGGLGTGRVSIYPESNQGLDGYHSLYRVGGVRNPSYLSFLFEAKFTGSQPFSSKQRYAQTRGHIELLASERDRFFRDHPGQSFIGTPIYVVASQNKRGEGWEVPDGEIRPEWQIGSRGEDPLNPGVEIDYHAELVRLANSLGVAIIHAKVARFNLPFGASDQWTRNLQFQFINEIQWADHTSNPILSWFGERLAVDPSRTGWTYTYPANLDLRCEAAQEKNDNAVRPPPGGIQL